MNCPNCKAVGALRVIRAGALGSLVYVACEAPGCHWSQEPLPEFVIEAAVKTYRAAQPRKPVSDHAFEPSIFEDDECSEVTDEADDLVMRCRRPASEHLEVA